MKEDVMTMGKQKRLLGLLLAVVLLISVPMQASANTQTNAITRIAGSDRHDTAFKVADMLKQVLGIEKYQYMILASGENFADALAGSYLATVKQAPILLCRGETSYSRNLEYIKGNLKEDGLVYILGGDAAVPQAQEDLLKENGISCIRLKGKTRFDTNLAILEEAGIIGNEILVSTGYNFADSLSASASGKPILLLHSNANVLTEAQVAYLEKLSGMEFIIVGGTGAVSEILENALKEYGTVTRVKGSGREATSVKVAENYFRAPEQAILAYSRNFPDGLCGGPLAYALGAPLLLVNKGAETPAASYVMQNQIRVGYVMGGTAVIAEESVDIVFAVPEVKMYTVIFQDYDGTILKTEQVEEGKSAIAPENPQRDGFVFSGWDQDYTNIIADTIVTAQYQEITTPMLYVSDVTASAGETGVTVVCSIKNNPGIMGMTLKLSYNENAMVLKNAQNGNACRYLTMTAPGIFVNNCKFVWDAMEVKPEDIEDGQILILTFDILDTATAGTYGIGLSYTHGDIFDGEWNDIALIMEHGSIQIS